MGDNRLVEVVETVVDRLDNVSASLSLPTPDRIHVRALRSLLPEIANDLRAALRLAAAAVPPPGARGDAKPDPTHRCKLCGALWRLNGGERHVFRGKEG